jgi:hypothetical protein
MTRRSGGIARATAAAALLLGASGCAFFRDIVEPAPKGSPAGREGWLVYPVAELRFEAPASWTPAGSSRHLRLHAPDGGARLEVSTSDEPFADEKACLADAEERMKKTGGLERVRRHATKFAGVPAQTLEGDQGGWHVWAWAACDGGTQYQVFFTARSPAPPDVLEAHKTLVSTARVGGEA